LLNSLKVTLETIPVVEDTEILRTSVVAFLQRANFQVLSADGPASAMKLASETDRKIDLLLSDVEMQRDVGSGLGTVTKEDPSGHARDVNVR